MADETSVCKECGNNGKAMKEITLKSLVKEPKLEVIKHFDEFYSKTANTTWRKPVDEAEWFSRKNTKVFLRTRAEQKYYGCKPIDF